MRVLDLYCGGGGSSGGIMRHNENIPGERPRCDRIEIVGVDIQDQPEYPYSFFSFLQADVLGLPVEFIAGFDFVWASPPCQAYSYAAARWRNTGRTWPDLVGSTRDLLDASRVPYVIENVSGAPIRRDLMLCGEMFGLRVIRHRLFEISGFECSQPDHVPHRGMVKDGFYVTVAGNGGDYAGHNFCRLNGLAGATQLETWQYAMEIDWLTDKKRLREAVPPAYAEHIFGGFLGALRER